MVFYALYDCVYSAEGKVGSSPDKLVHKFVVPLRHYACYSSVYSELRANKYSEVTYRVYLYKENLEGKNFNLCTKPETKKILRCLQKTVPFSYKFETDSYKKSEYSNEITDYNVLVVSLSGTFAQHLWVTTMLRCFFEWPYNVAAKEACELQSKVKKVDNVNLERENWINLYLTVASQLGSTNLHGVVDFRQEHPKSKTYQEWRSQLQSIVGDCLLCDLLRKGGRRLQNNKKIDIADQEIYDRGIIARAPKYVAAYKDKLSWKK